MVLTRRGLRFWGKIIPFSQGLGGIRKDKREGDGATPAGVHRVVGMLYRPDRLAAPAPWAEPIRVADLWSDASGDAAYNQLVRAPYPHSHERLRRSDALYDIILITNWNYPVAEAGKGSAIFLHQWRSPGYPTAGCIAFSRTDLRWIASRVEPGTRVIVPETLAD